MKKLLVLAMIVLLFGTSANAASMKGSANIRSGPGSEFPVIGSASRGNKIVIIKNEGDWVEIHLNGNRTGYVYKDFIKFDEEQPSSETSAVPPTFDSTAAIPPPVKTEEKKTEPQKQEKKPENQKESKKAEAPKQTEQKNVMGCAISYDAPVVTTVNHLQSSKKKK